MPGRSPAAAVAAYKDALGKAVSCVTDVIVNVGGYHPAEDDHALVLGHGAPVKLAGPDDLRLELQQTYRLHDDEDGWRVTTTRYAYTLHLEDAELLAFHWHPAGPSGETAPHLHIEAGAGTTYKALERAHIPTGRIAVEQVLRLAIDGFGVEHRRDDWVDVLADTQARYEPSRTWV